MKYKTNESSKGQQSKEKYEKTEPVLDQSQLVTKEEGGEMIKERRNMVVRVSKKVAASSMTR